MGYIFFASRSNAAEFYYDNLLEGTEPFEDELSSYSIGDRVELEWPVAQDAAEQLAAKKLDQVSLAVYTNLQEETVYHLVLPFIVKAKVHNIRPDWVEPRIGLRSMDHRIVVEAVSEDVEALFRALTHSPEGEPPAG